MRFGDARIDVLRARGLGKEFQPHRTVRACLECLRIELPEPAKPQSGCTCFEPAGTARFGRMLFDSRGQGRLVEPRLQPEPIHPYEVAHPLALPVDKAEDDPDMRFARVRDDSGDIIERAILMVCPY